MTVYIGCGAGFAGDRFDAAAAIIAELASRDAPKYLMFECLAERTLASAQLEKLKDPSKGYSPFLDQYFSRHLGAAMSAGVKIVSNLGAAHPISGAQRVREIAAEQGLKPPRVAVVMGDDLSETMSEVEIRDLPLMDGQDVIHRTMRAANVYLGAEPVAEAAATGADVILVGRTTDSALALGPLMHEYGWTDLDRLAAGTITGHLLECGAQVSGAYFADPGKKDVPDLARVGFPIAEVQEDGSFVITKPKGTGGLVDRATVTEQLLYEMHDPAAYLVPEASCDVTGLTLSDDGENRIRVGGVKGHARPEKLKATVSVDFGWMAEAEISYAGIGALARTQLAGEIVETRMRDAGVTEEIAFDIIGGGATFGRGAKQFVNDAGDGDYRLRLSIITDDKATAQLLNDELYHLYCSGPSAGGGIRNALIPQMATASVMVPRDLVSPRIEVIE